jgi:hypothetical protein
MRREIEEREGVMRYRTKLSGVIVLAWWFFTLTGNERVVGPFKNAQECERIRSWMMTALSDIGGGRQRVTEVVAKSFSPCWEG